MKFYILKNFEKTIRKLRGKILKNAQEILENFEEILRKFVGKTYEDL